MCIGFDPFCFYTPSTSAAFRFDVTVSPITQDPLQVEALQFYQQAPETFNWINGQSGINNFPTKYGLRVFKNGVLIHDARDIPTTRAWQQEVFDFRGNPAFEVTTETTFNFELMAYCSAGIIGGDRTIWDLENIQVTANCIGECAPLDIAGDVGIVGGGTEFFGCIWTTQLQLTNTSTFQGDLYNYLIIDETRTIVNVIGSDGLVDMTSFTAGRYEAIGYVDLGEGTPLIGASLDNLPDLMCLSTSQNSVTIFINEPDGGRLTGGPFEFCNDDLSMDFVPVNGLTLIDNRGSNTQWVVTDAEGQEILALPFNIYELDFESLPPGICLIWNLSYDGWIRNLTVGTRISDLEGFASLDNNTIIPACFDLSNSVPVFKTRLTPSVLTGGPFTFCTGDGLSDQILEADVMVSRGSGIYNSWVLTDVMGVEIFAVTDDLSNLEFDNRGRRNCTLWSLTHDVPMADLVEGGDFSNLVACSSRSNFISIIKLDNEGGTIAGGPFEFCTRDGIDDFIPNGAVTLDGNTGANNQWFVADASGTILTTLVDNFSTLNLEPLTPGNGFLYHISYDGPISGINIGDNLSSVDGCFSLSNTITINKIDCTPLTPGTLTGGPFQFCTADGTPDRLVGLTMQGADGARNAWVIADIIGTILSRFDNAQTYDTEVLGEGNFLIYHITYDVGLTGLEAGQNLFTDLVGKHALSQAITLTRSIPLGGTIAGSPQVFCVGDGAEDRILDGDLTLTNADGNSVWIVTDGQSGVILDIADNYRDFDFENSGDGQSQLHHLSYFNTLTGLEVNNNLSNVVGCFQLSNALSITKNIVDGGVLDNGSGFIQFCVGDGFPDFIPAGSVTLTGNIGDEHQWVITNTSGTEVLALPNSPYEVDFEDTGIGTSVLWNVSSVGGVPDLQLGADLSQLQGCSARSTFITIFRVQNTGGTLSGGPFNFCVQDGIPDFIPDGAVTINDNLGANSQWIVVNEAGIITETPINSFSEINFDQAVAGSYTLYHISYDGPITGLGDNLSFDELDGCLSLSDGIPIVNTICPSAMDDIDLFQVSSTNTITLTNTGEEELSVSDFWLSHKGESVKVEELTELCGKDLSCGAGEYLILTLPFEIDINEGSVTLHLESIHEEKLIKDFVQWGATGQDYEQEAIAAGLWGPGQIVVSPLSGMAITPEYPQTDAQRWTSVEPMSCQATTSTTDQENISINLYPNPTANLVRLDGLSADQRYRYEIRNAMGQLISSGQLKGESIEVSALDSGSYILSIQSQDMERSLRFSKL